METPQERRQRRHEEDKIENPHRHFIDKPYYTYEEALELCPYCAKDSNEKYGYCHMTRNFWRKND